jgi:hypothetical protein
MATVANIKSALSSGANIFNDGKTVGTAEIARMQAWFEADYANELDGNAATADDFSAWCWRQVAAKVKNYEEKDRAAANSEPAVEDFTGA